MIINEIFIGSFTEKTEEEQKEILEKFREDNIHEKNVVIVIQKKI